MSTRRTSSRQQAGDQTYVWIVGLGGLVSWPAVLLVVVILLGAIALSDAIICKIRSRYDTRRRRPRGKQG